MLRAERREQRKALPVNNAEVKEEKKEEKQ